MRLILGDTLPNTHHQLVTLAQQYFTALRTLHHVILSKVVTLASSATSWPILSIKKVSRNMAPWVVSQAPAQPRFLLLILATTLTSGSLLRLLDMLRRHTPLIPTLSPGFG